MRRQVFWAVGLFPLLQALLAAISTVALGEVTPPTGSRREATEGKLPSHDATGLRIVTDAASEDAAAEAFFDGPVQFWEITLASPLVASLRNAPRDYVPATVRAGEFVFKNVGVHLKGSAGSKRSVDDRPSLTLKFNRFRKGQRAFGCEKLHLNNAVQDPSSLHENLGSRIYRSLGIPTTRATHALLRFNGRDLGVYVVKEAFDDDFIRRHFPEDRNQPGNLYEGAFVGDVDRNLERDAGGGPADRSDLERLRAALKKPASERWTALTNVLEVDHFLTLAAAQLILDDRDGYVRNRNNYRVFFHGGNGRAEFMPHGMDQLLVHEDAPVRDAWMSLVSQALFALPGQRIRLRDRMLSLVKSGLDETTLLRETARLQARLEDALIRYDAGARKQFETDRGDLAARIRRRLASVKRQLAEWPDPLPPWKPGQTLAPTTWNLLVQGGAVRTETDSIPPGSTRSLHLVVERPDTRASFRSTTILPVGRYRLVARCRTRSLNPLEDQFGRGAAVRVIGATADAGARLEGDHDWTPLAFHFEQADDGPVELIVEVRANAGEAWFDAESIRIEGE